MQLYIGNTQEFINDSKIVNCIADMLRDRFIEYYRKEPSIGEYNSWRNSLRQISNIFSDANLLDHGVLLEYQLSNSEMRIDCIITGYDEENKKTAVIIELKQWSNSSKSIGEQLVKVKFGDGLKDILHPSVQVDQYRKYLYNSSEIFYASDSCIRLKACCYLHNYENNEDDEVFDKKFDKYLRVAPVFTKGNEDEFSEILKLRLSKGNGFSIAEEISNCSYKINNKVIKSVSKLFEGNKGFLLMDEQLVVFNFVISKIKTIKDDEKYIIIIQGNPGTGKSVIGINLLMSLQDYQINYVTGSGAFTKSLIKMTKSISNTSQIFKYFNSYSNTKCNQFDVLICDEAHRIKRRNQSNNNSQISEIINACRISVVFLDEYQQVRPNEIGSVKYFEESAMKSGIKKENIFKFNLKNQFRCSGSSNYIDWISKVLNIDKRLDITTSNLHDIWNYNSQEFDFKICESPFEMETKLKNKCTDTNGNLVYDYRIVSGFCWNWSKKLDENNKIVSDIKIGEYVRAWNAWKETEESLESPYWGIDNNAINQIGCIYTCQGFEFDYVGVIFGKDLTYDMDKSQWVGKKEYNYDSQVNKCSEGEFIKYIKNTYRVLLTRGIKGCYIYFEDSDTEKFFKSRIENYMH